MSSIVLKKATEVVAGDRVVEQDGAYFKVTAVRRRGRLVEYSLNDESGCYMIVPKMATVAARSMVRVLTPPSAS